MNEYETIPDRWVGYLRGTPETGMGYWIVSVTLEDGTVYDEVVINGGLITQAHGYSKVPFSASQIKDVVVTHDKWNFLNSRDNETRP